jgi:hypothetical protein
MSIAVDLPILLQRLEAADWNRMATELDRQGWSVLPGILSPADCGSIASLYDEGAGFRSQIFMARHGFGRGEYRYFDYPLPGVVQALREALYRRLAPVANIWHAAMGLAESFPDDPADFLARSKAVGLRTPTPCCSAT